MAVKPNIPITLPWEIPATIEGYGLAYYFEFWNFSETQICRVEILRKNFSGDPYRILKGSMAPLTIAHNGGGKDNFENVVIQGLQITFTFYMPRADVDLLDAMFESDRKDHMVKYYINDEIEFIGWLQPENLVKNYSKNPPWIEISVTAYDGLVDLKEIDFSQPDPITTKGRPYEGRIRLLEILKYALSRTEIPLDFKIQLNTWEGITPPPVTYTKYLATEGIKRCITTEDGLFIIIEE